MKIRTLLVLLSLASAASAETPPAHPAMAPVERYMMASAKDEIALARTAAPPSISADASVLVLDRRGYREAVHGRNGFVCFIERSWTAGFDDPVFWDPAIRAPNCFNPPAAKSVLPQYLARTRWVLAGASRDEMKAKTKAAFAAHRFTQPAPASFSFMLSRRGDLGDPANGGPWLPHVMFFVPHGQGTTWAAGLEASPVIGQESLPYEPTVLYIPVRRWSDGTPAPVASDLSHKM
jgi:hypothetical protein